MLMDTLLDIFLYTHVYSQINSYFKEIILYMLTLKSLFFLKTCHGHHSIPMNTDTHDHLMPSKYSTYRYTTINQLEISMASNFCYYKQH